MILTLEGYDGGFSDKLGSSYFFSSINKWTLTTSIYLHDFQNVSYKWKQDL